MNNELEVTHDVCLKCHDDIPIGVWQETTNLATWPRAMRDRFPKKKVSGFFFPQDSC